MNNYSVKSTFIRKRGNNYNVVIEYINEEGKLKQKSVGKYTTKKEADKHKIEIQCSINNNKFTVPKDVTFVDRCYKYIDDNRTDWSENTTVMRESFVKNQVAPFFRDTKLADITVYQLQQFVNSLYNNYTPGSARTRYSFVRAVIRECYRLRELNENICEFVKLPKKEQTDITDVYSKEEVVNLVLALSGTSIEMPILLMLLLGLRKNEACGLRWKDIDFDNNLISINQILVYQDSKVTFKKPKTAKSVRVLHASNYLMRKLRELKAKHDEYAREGIENKYDLVCLNRNFDCYKGCNLNVTFKIFCKNNNFKQIRLHDLRHTNATLMVLAGINNKVISDRLGHSDIKISLNKYSHVLPEMDKSAANKISDLLTIE